MEPESGMIQIKPAEPVILDADMAHEDMFASLFLMAHPNVDVKAITVSGTGEAHCSPGVSNTLGLVALSDEEVPVACGQETPLTGSHAFPAAWRQDADEVYGVKIPTGGEAASQNAPDLMADILEESDQEISIVAVGPLTNIADAIQKYPQIVSKVKMIYIMGGAVKVDGNVGESLGIENEHAEWNIYIDPQAANIVFASGIPVTLVPLDATRDVPVTRKFHRALGDNSDTPASELVHEIISANLDFVDSGGFQFWDSLTAAIFTDQSLASFEDMRLTVVEGDGPQSGYTKPDPNGANIRVAVGANKAQFEKLLLTILNRAWE